MSGALDITTLSPGTGYIANMQPAIYYSPGLDLYDYPRLSFQSQTKRHYHRLAVSNKTASLPRIRGQNRERSYLQLHTTSRPNTVYSQTEHKVAYVPYRTEGPVCHDHRIVGAKEKSGFTHGSSVQPYTFIPLDVCTDVTRQTQRSVTSTDFIPPTSHQGAKPFLKFVTLQESAFTRGTRNLLACPASLHLHPCGLGEKSVPYTEKDVGLKEASGFVLNGPVLTTLPHTPWNPQHFLTHYQSKFSDPAALEGHTVGRKGGGIIQHRDNAYSRRDTDRFNLYGY